MAKAPKDSALPRILPQPERRHVQLASLWLLCCAGAVSACRTSEPEGQQTDQTKKAATTTATATAKTPQPPSTSAKQNRLRPVKPITPSPPPQLVACGTREFYRIREKAAEVFEVSTKELPPNIRGSRIARQTKRFDIEEATNVVILKDGSTLVVAETNVFRLRLEEKEAQPHGSIGAKGAVHVWADAGSKTAFWVREEKAREVKRYDLPAGPSKGSKASGASPPPQAETAPSATRTLDMPEYDARLFATASEGTPLYSTEDGVRRLGAAPGVAPFPEPSRSAVALFADASAERFWAAEPEGKLALWSSKQPEKPVAASVVPGTFIDADTDGKRVAVLSMEIDEQSYRPTVTVFENGEQKGRLSVAPTFTPKGQPKLDLCLLPGRTWVVVGGKHWLQLLDWSSPRLLAEW